MVPGATSAAEVNKPKATWVEPSLLAEVEYLDITSEGYPRHLSFKGLAKPRR
jgi:bifunctional non-homologous end joining protein LigD